MEQMKVVIAEDEPIVARYVKGILDSLGGFTVAAVCESGEEAIMVCKEMNPRLLITDIKMPGITGLDLIQQLKEQGLEEQITVIISGYKSFDYAKKAIALGVEEYITKPINPEELKKTLIRIQEGYWRKSFVEKGIQMERAIRNQDNDYFKAQFPYKQCRMLLVYQSGEAEDMDYQVNVSSTNLSFYYRNALMILDGGNEEESLIEMQKLVKQITLSRNRRKTCTVMLIRNMDSSGECFQSFRRLHRILRELTIPGKLIFREYETPNQIKRQIEFWDEEIIKKIELHIDAKEWLSVGRHLRELFDFWEKNRYALYRIKTVIHRVTDRMQKVELFDQGKLFINEYLDECIQYADEYGDMKEVVCGYLEDMLLNCRTVQQEGKDSTRLYEKIRRFVMQNEDKNFSLNEISDLFGVSQPFIRKIFRTHVGMSYKEWILEMKIERSKELMRTSPNLLIKDVAEKLGFEQLYFSTVFNKYTGMSPSEYKFMQHRGRDSSV